MKACRRFREDLSGLLDGTLAPAARESLQAHLDQCPACRQALEELRLTVDRIRALEPVEPPPWLAERILEGVRARPRPLRRPPSRGPRLQLPAAAVLLLCLAGYLVTRVSGPRNLPAPPLPAAPKAPAPASPPPAAVRPKAAARPEATAEPGMAKGRSGAAAERAEPPAERAEPPAKREADLAMPQSGAAARRAEAPAAKALAPPALVLRLAALDPEGAGPRVEDAVRGAGGTLSAAVAPGQRFLTAQMPAGTLPALLERLEALGRVEGERPDPQAMGAPARVRIVW